QPAAIDLAQAQRETVKRVRNSGRLRESLVVVERYEMPADKRQFIGAKEKLIRYYVITLSNPVGEIGVNGEIRPIDRSGEFHAILTSLGIVERSKNEGRPKLTFVDQVAGFLIVAVEVELDAARQHLRNSGVKVVRALWCGGVIDQDRRLVSRADKFPDVLA